MKFIKQLKFDIKYGIGNNYAVFLGPLLIAIPAVIDTIFKINSYVSLEGNENVAYSMGDVWFSIYGGMEEYISSPDNPFNFTVIWSVLILLGAFLVLNYPLKDMFGVGAQYLVRGGSRKTWWMSKVIWNLLVTVIFHGIIFGTVFIGCFISHIPLKFNINVSLIEVLYEFKQPVDLRFVNYIPLSVIVLPVIVSICMNLIQMTISLLINPIYSFIINAVLVISSAFIMNVCFIYNYAMPLRYKWIYTGGFTHRSGFLAVIVLAVVFTFAGLMRIKGYDILRRGEDSSGD